ncbi:MAG: hypothetical protein HY693_00205 [Deltaproteobacteria bacterium]|nr:hypothetical protein [Deltaproteobacteria bacterium]
MLTMAGVIGFKFMGEFVIKDVYEFSPDWAAGREFLSQFIAFFTSKSLFLVTTCFILGGLQICTRLNKAGFYALLTAVVPILLILPTSVQLPRYIYHVFPLFVMISSYFVYNFSRYESKVAYSLLGQSELIKKLSPETIPLLVPAIVLLIFCLLSVPAWFVNISNIAYDPTGLGGEHHANWKEACSYLKGNYKDGDVIVSTIPLAARFHCGKFINYSMDNGHIADNRELGKTKNGLFPDIYSEAESITDIEELKMVITKNTHGWLILDRNRFYNPTHVPEDINRFINNNLIPKYTTSDQTVVIFEWNENHSSKHNSQ